MANNWSNSCTFSRYFEQIANILTIMKMKTQHYLPIFLALIILIVLCKMCNNKVITPSANHVKKTIDSIHDEIAILKPLERSSDSIRTVIKWKYRTLHDTVPCETKLVYCDSVIYRDSISISYKDSILSKYDSLYPKYQLLAKVDSCTIDSLTRSKKKYWKGFKLGFGIGFSVGIIGGAFSK